MNKERAAELLPIIKAFSEGKKIRRKSPGKDYWMPKVDEIDFNIPGDYEIAPEPLVLYVNVYKEEDVFNVYGCFDSKHSAIRAASANAIRVGVKMVEKED